MYPCFSIRCSKKRNYEDKKSPKGLLKAEREGFEPSIELPLYQLSRRALSTTQAPLRYFELAKIEKIQGSFLWSLRHQTKYE